MRIANCSGFYGDRLSAAAEQVEGGEIDVLCGDYLAELTMALLLRDRMSDPDAGYAKTFLVQLRQVMAACLDRNIRVVANAGGLNPAGLARAVRALAGELGLSPRIAWVEGDDVSGRLGEWQKQGDPLSHMDTGAPLASAGGMPVSANAYLGCWPIAQALDRGADIVITGRCTDAAVVMGAAASGHGWKREDFDVLAGALVAGHIIECGTQATGGNLSFYDEVPGLDRVGFPIAEIAADGTSVITKHAGTGGAVTVDSVKAQLLYEIGSPLYISPDVVADFRTVQVTQEDTDRVRVHGTRGLAPPRTLKVGLNVTAGHRNQVKVLLGGPDVADKAERVEQAFWQRVGGRESFEDTRAELIGGTSDPETPTDALAVLLLSARSMDKSAVGRRFTAGAVELALASVPGITLLDPPGPPRPCIQFWPVAVDRERIDVVVHMDETAEPVAAWLPPAPDVAVDTLPPGPVDFADHDVVLGELVGTRSGDKAGSVNVGFWVRDPAHADWLRATVTSAWVAEVLDVSPERVSVYALPSLGAVNVLVTGWLGLGVGASLAADAQGKCLGEFFRTLHVAGPGDTSGLGGAGESR